MCPTPAPTVRPSITSSHSLPGHALPVYKLPPPPETFILFFSFSSYLPCWRDRDQKGGSLLLELCIAHRGSPGGQVIFGYLAGIIFDGSLSRDFLFINFFHGFMLWVEEEGHLRVSWLPRQARFAYILSYYIDVYSTSTFVRWVS